MVYCSLPAFHSSNLFYPLLRRFESRRPFVTPSVLGATHVLQRAGLGTSVDIPTVEGDRVTSVELLENGLSDDGDRDRLHRSRGDDQLLAIDPDRIV